MQTEQAIGWAIDYMQMHGPAPTGPAEPVRTMPWSMVARVPTGQGFVYLKQMAPTFAQEGRLLTTLAGWNGVWPLPRVLASNEALDCFLMEDSGVPLRGVLRQHYDVGLVTSLMSACAEIQKTSMAHIDNLLAMGLPDWRLENWPRLYADLIEHATAQQIDPDILLGLEGRKDALAKLCDRLAAYNIPATLEHSDFNDSNVLIKDGVAMLSDWGDAAINHPFFSLSAWLGSVRRNHGFMTHDPRYIAIRDAYLQCWQDYGAMDQLLGALAITDKLNPLRFAISFSRVSQCEGFGDYAEYHGYLAKSLGEFLDHIVPLP